MLATSLVVFSKLLSRKYSNIIYTYDLVHMKCFITYVTSDIVRIWYDNKCTSDSLAVTYSTTEPSLVNIDVYLFKSEPKLTLIHLMYNHSGNYIKNPCSLMTLLTQRRSFIKCQFNQIHNQSGN